MTELKAVTVEKEFAGRTLKLETGRVGRQANSCMVTYGESVVFVAATVGGETTLPFFPLTVDYRENTYAAGKFPGGFFKREGRPSTKEILSARVIDRTNRPLFPKGYNNECMVACQVLSADDENDTDILAMIGAGAGLAMSDGPYHGPAAGVRVGRVDDELVLFPTHSQREVSTLDLIVSGTKDALLMVESSALEVPEEVILDAMEMAHEAIKEIVDMILELAEKAGSPYEAPEEQKEEIPAVFEELKKKYYDDYYKANQIEGKSDRKAALDELNDKIEEEYAKKLEEDEEFEEELSDAISHLLHVVIRDQILKEKKRHDGRGLTDIRPLSVDVGLLPRVHGSSLFTRGETQSMVSVTLGTAVDEQKVDGLQEAYNKKFMLHYNFPSYCVGETWPNRGPKRREIGHGMLAERALRAVLPEDESDFPYTVRVVAQTMESNGSSSMAAVCGGTLALMDAGMPIQRPVAGIAMGLVAEDGEFRILSDITGTEDHHGNMDFKVAGTQVGITALQMDIKMKGISRKVLSDALNQAREGRIHILKTMLDSSEGGLASPRQKLSPYAPRLVQLPIEKDKIGALIGPGGKTIRRIQEETETNIEIDDDEQTVTIAGFGEANMNKAVQIVKSVIEDPEVGKIYEGKVVSIKDFGAFIEIAPGQEGLCHISELSDEYVKNVTDVVSMDEMVKVKVLKIDDKDRIKLSMRAAQEELQEAAS